MKKTYLGDGVYVELVDSAIIKLTTENGSDTTNTIWLEWDTWDNLTNVILRFIADQKAAAQQPQP